MHFQKNCFRLSAADLHKQEVNTGFGNGLVPSGSNPLPEAMLTIRYDNPDS